MYTRRGLTGATNFWKSRKSNQPQIIEENEEEEIDQTFAREEIPRNKIRISVNGEQLEEASSCRIRGTLDQNSIQFDGSLACFGLLLEDGRTVGVKVNKNNFFDSDMKSLQQHQGKVEIAFDGDKQRVQVHRVLSLRDLREQNHTIARGRVESINGSYFENSEKASFIIRGQAGATENQLYDFVVSTKGAALQKIGLDLGQLWKARYSDTMNVNLSGDRASLRSFSMLGTPDRANKSLRAEMWGEINRLLEYPNFQSWMQRNAGDSPKERKKILPKAIARSPKMDTIVQEEKKVEIQSTSSFTDDKNLQSKNQNQSKIRFSNDENKSSRGDAKTLGEDDGLLLQYAGIRVKQFGQKNWKNIDPPSRVFWGKTKTVGEDVILSSSGGIQHAFPKAWIPEKYQESPIALRFSWERGIGMECQTAEEFKKSKEMQAARAQLSR